MDSSASESAEKGGGLGVYTSVFGTLVPKLSFRESSSGSCSLSLSSRPSSSSYSPLLLPTSRGPRIRSDFEGIKYPAHLLVVSHVHKIRTLSRKCQYKWTSRGPMVYNPFPFPTQMNPGSERLCQSRWIESEANRGPL